MMWSWRRHSVRSPRHQSGQAMTEYVIVTAFGLMVLLGPGIDILKETANVIRRNYDGYSYAMSLSPLPDYGTGEQMRTAMLGEQIDQATIDQLGVDPLEDAMLQQLATYTGYKNQLTNTVNSVKNININSIFGSIKNNLPTIP